MGDIKRTVRIGLVSALPLAASLASGFPSKGKYCDTPSRCLDPIGAHAMVTSPNYLASQVGMNVLRDGGNAVDAAVAMAAALAVVYPQMNTIGGDNFWLIYNARTRQLRGLNASGRSGEKATIAFYAAHGFDKAIPPRGYLSANTVPGAVSGWSEAHAYARAAIGHELSWPRLLQPAIDLASQGFPVSPSLARWEEADTDPSDPTYRDLQRFDGFRQTFLRPDSEPYRVGEILTQPDLARTLRLIATEGSAAFYRGPVARKIVADVQAHGGLLTLDDFARHQADWVDPIHVDYRGYQAYNLPPNTQGFASLEILNILNNIDLAKLGEGTADYYQALVEATRLAFADRDRYLSDPAFVSVPLDWLLSPAHGREQAARIDLQHAASQVEPPSPQGDTVWFGVVDRDGNAASVIQSIYFDFGSGIVPAGTGVLLQNRGSYFSLDPANVNHLEPRKRTAHTLNPAMLFNDGKPALVYGTMGGEGQPQTLAQVVTRIVDFHLTPEDAICAPRFLLGTAWGAASSDLKLEGRIPAAVADELARRGQPVRVVADYTEVMGHAGAVLIDADHGVLYGAADPRGDGLALGE